MADRHKGGDPLFKFIRLALFTGLTIDYKYKFFHMDFFILNRDFKVRLNWKYLINLLPPLDKEKPC